MKIKFKDQTVSANGNKWLVSGHWDTETCQIKISRIEGTVDHKDIGEACYGLAVDKGWIPS
jgi:hypothetical protein